MKPIIFCGDTGIPFGVKVDIGPLGQLFEGKRALVNMEGALLLEPDEYNQRRFTDKYSLFNTQYTIELYKKLNVEAASLVNNHTRDFPFPLERTVDALNANNIKALCNPKGNMAETRLSDGKVVLTFATYGCCHNFKLFSQKGVLKRIAEIRTAEPDTKIAVFPHWGLELRTLPEPADRKFAHAMIDAGADIIVGHHPHVIQPVEVYNGKTIAYSIGNFIMPNAQAMGAKFTPNPATARMMLVEWDGANVKLHGLVFDPEMCTFAVDNDFVAPVIDSQTSDKEYRRQYISKVGRSHYLRFARYRSTDGGERGRWMRMKAYYLLRRALIKMHVYKPY